MFNRKLEVKMVKSNKEEATPAENTNKLQLVSAIGYQFERIVNKAGRAALTYVVLDTVRQVLVARAEKP